MCARLFLAGLLALAPALSGCSRQADERVPAKPAAAPRKAGTLFYYDLGPATVDVSGYPVRQRENYKLFISVCGTCHTTARPLNSPYAEADTWRRYTRRMRVKLRYREILLSKEDEERIYEFLVYDSKVRKISRGPEFAAEQEKLKARFREAPAPEASALPQRPWTER